jgi:hypothetical protein
MRDYFETVENFSAADLERRRTLGGSAQKLRST